MAHPDHTHDMLFSMYPWIALRRKGVFGLVGQRASIIIHAHGVGLERVHSPEERTDAQHFDGTSGTMASATCNSLNLLTQSVLCLVVPLVVFLSECRQCLTALRLMQSGV